MNDPVFETLTLTLPFAITGEVVLWLLWLLAGITGLVALVVTYHLYAFARPGLATTLIIVVHYAVSAALLTAATAAAFLFGI